MKKIIFCSFAVSSMLYAGDFKKDDRRRMAMVRFVSDLADKHGLNDTKKLEIARLVKDSFSQAMPFAHCMALKAWVDNIKAIVATQYALSRLQLSDLGYTAWIDECVEKQLFPY